MKCVSYGGNVGKSTTSIYTQRRKTLRMRVTGRHPNNFYDRREVNGTPRFSLTETLKMQNGFSTPCIETRLPPKFSLLPARQIMLPGRRSAVLVCRGMSRLNEHGLHRKNQRRPLPFDRTATTNIPGENGPCRPFSFAPPPYGSMKCPRNFFTDCGNSTRTWSGSTAASRG